MERKSYRIAGLYMSNCRIFCEFIFGKFFIKIQRSKIENIFEVIIRKKLMVKQIDGSFKEETIKDYVETDHFKNHFRGKIKLMSYDDSE